MKKLVIIIICSIIAILSLILILMFNGIIPNIFLDRSDLVCSRVYVETETMKQEDYIVIYFNNKALVKGGKKESHIIYYDETLLQENYETMKGAFGEKKDDNVYGVELDNNMIIVNSELELALNHVGLNKKEIKKIYKEYGYACQ